MRHKKDIRRGLDGLHRSRIVRAAMAAAIIAALATASILLPSLVRSAQAGPSEYEIKAACLYNFIKFVKWPKEADSQDPGEVVVGIVGEDPFGAAFAPVENKPITAGGTVLTIKRFGPYSPGLDLSGCRILFISSSERENAGRILKSLRGKPVLTVSDSQRFLETGGMINLVMVDQSVKWEINRRPVEESGLVLSAQVLRLAVRVVYLPR